MVALELFEVFFTILWLAFMITEIVIPLVKEVPLFPTFRKIKNAKTKKKE